MLSLSLLYSQIIRSDDRIDIFQFLAENSAASLEERVAVMQLDLARMWESNRIRNVEEYVETTPQLSSRPDLIAQLVMEECSQRQRRGEVVSPEEYWNRFPDLRKQLAPLLAGEWQTFDASSPDPSPMDRSLVSTILPIADELAETVVPPVSPAPRGELKASDTGTISRIGRYENFEEIARGGMGVVYKAFDRQLDRVVAVKLIKAGELADQEAVQRFHIEAQAAGHLDHSGIVPVYEVGQQGQQHFLVMAFVDGKSLWQRVKESPMKPKDAASIVLQVAEAMSYAHEKGIIHRDLKPQNILLTKDGRPKVTDFGLAKRQSGDSSLTATGQVMGTPSYMPPEQVTGKTDEIGPLADVYSLGATLYCLLTGRPPFQAATILETMQQVIEREAVSPRVLDPSIDRDLETICLKCLEKNRSNRFSSARMLADELARYLRGDPILSRPVGPVSRLARWARRNPLGTALTLSVILVFVALGISGLVIQQSRRASEVSALKDQLQGLVEKPELSSAYLDLGENLISQISKLSFNQTAVLQDRLWGAYADRIERDLKRADVKPADLEQLDTPLNLLSSRNPKREQELRSLLVRRNQSWQQVFAIKSPFSDLRETFPDQQLQPVDQVLEANSAMKFDSDFVIRSKSTAKGPMRLEVTLDHRWRTAKQLTLELSASTQVGYRFSLVRTTAPVTKDENASSELTLTRIEPQDDYLVRFERNGKVLRQQSVPASDLADTTEMTISATRQRRKLTFQFGKMVPLTFEDPFPLGGSIELKYGIGVPERVGVVQMIGSQMPENGASIPLEQGDVLYDSGRWNDAFASYQHQRLIATTQEIKEECLYKQALCLLETGKTEDATTLFEECFSTSQSRWGQLAGFQLWIQMLRQKRQLEADGIFERLSSSTSQEKNIVATVPEEIRREILLAYRGRDARRMALIFSPESTAMRPLQLHADVETLLWNGEPDQIRILESLRNGYCDRGQYEDAAGINQKLKKLRPDCYTASWEIKIERMQGNMTQAMELANKYQVDDQGRVKLDENPLVIDYSGYLRMERIYCLAALNEWDQVERELIPLRKALGNTLGPETWRTALMEYLLLTRRGDLEGARKVAHNALVPADQQGKAAEAAEIRITGPNGTLEQFLLRGLSGGIEEQEMRAVLRKFEGESTGMFGSVASSVLKPETIVGPVNRLFHSPKGLACVEKVILDQGNYLEVVHLVCTRLFVEYVRANAFDGELTEIQERIIESAGEDLFDAVRREPSFLTTQLMPLATTWKGVANFLGWNFVAKTLPPKRRQYFAYLFAHRFLSLNNSPQAISLLKEIIGISAEDKEVVALAENDLDLLTRQQGCLSILNEHSRPVVISVRSQGQQATQREVKGSMGRETMTLAPGDYELELVDSLPGVGIIPTKLTVKTGRYRVVTISSLWQPGASEYSLRGIVDRPARLPGVCRWQMVLTEPEAWTAASVSPNGRQVALGDEDGYIRLHRLSDFSLQQVFPTAQAPIDTLTWNSRGELLAAASLKSSKIRLWNARDSKAGPVLEGHRAGVACLAWSPSGDLLASSGFWTDGTIRISDPKRPSSLKTEDLGLVRSLTWSGDSQRIAAANYSPVIRIFSQDLQSVQQIVTPDDNAVNSLAWHPSTGILAASSQKQTNLYQMDSGGRSARLTYSNPDSFQISSMSWNRNGTQLLLGENSGIVRCFAFHSDGLNSVWTSKSRGFLRQLSWLPPEERLWVSLQNSNLLTCDDKDICVGEHMPKQGLLTSTEIRNCGKIISGRQTDGRVGLYELTGRCLRLVPGVTSRRAPCFSPDGRYLAIADEVTQRIKICLAETDSGVETDLIELPQPVGRVQSMVWETNSKRVAVCMEDGRVWICPIDKSQAEMLPLEVPAYQLAMHPGGTLLAIATKDISPARLLYWDFSSQKLRFDIQRTTDHSVTQMAWSPDGHLLALALETGTIQLMDVEAKRGPTLAEKHWGPAHICWSDDSQLLAVVGSERSCRIWSTDGTLKQVIPNGWDASILVFSSVQPELTFWSRIGLERRSVATGEQLQRLVIWPDGKFLEIRNSGEIVRCSPEARDRIRFIVELSGQRLETCTWQQFEELIGLPMNAADPIANDKSTAFRPYVRDVKRLMSGKHANAISGKQ